jgi:hypothetical protein
VPPSRNLQGVSFAVANMTGFVARTLQSYPREQLLAGLLGMAHGVAAPRER